MSHRKSEFPPPFIEAINERNAHILRRIAVAMLKRPAEDNLDFLVCDADKLTMSYCTGDLGFNPLSARAQEYLSGKGEHLWFAGWLVVGHPEAEALVAELERSGLKLGVHLGYRFGRLEIWLDRVKKTPEYESSIGVAWGLIAMTFSGLWIETKLGDGGSALLWSFAIAIVTGYLTSKLMQLFRRFAESWVAKKRMERLEFWRRTLTE